MNQTLEERINNLRSMVVDYNTGVIEDKDVIKKEMRAINKLNNSEFELYFYTYKPLDVNKPQAQALAEVSRVCGYDLHSELFLIGLEELITNVHNYQITDTTCGSVVSLNNDIIFGEKELSLSKYLPVDINKNDVDCAYAAASYLNSYAINNKIIDIYFMHKRVIGFNIEIKGNTK